MGRLPASGSTNHQKKLPMRSGNVEATALSAVMAKDHAAYRALITKRAPERSRRAPRPRSRFRATPSALADR